MMTTNQQFSISRFIQLLKYDFNNNRFHYLLAIPVAMLAIGVILWVSFPDPKSFHQSAWRPGNYIPLFVLGYLIFGILIAGNSFPGLKSKTATIGYLTLPASTMEKFTAQWFIRILLFLILYPLIFKVTAILTSTIYIAVNGPGTDIALFDIGEAFNIPRSDRTKMFLIWILIIMLPTLGVSLLFLGGTIFRKWNTLLGPLSILGLILFSFLYINIVFDMLTPGSGKFGDFDINIEYPKLFDNQIPLVFFSAICLGIVLCFVCWIAAYFRLKEKEV